MVLLTGLTASSSYHFDSGSALQGSDCRETGTTEIGSNSGPAILCCGAPAAMEVWSAWMHGLDNALWQTRFNTHIAVCAQQLVDRRWLRYVGRGESAVRLPEKGTPV